MKTLTFKEEDGNALFPLGILLASTITENNSSCKKNSFSINIIIDNNTKGSITLLEGKSIWHHGEKEVFAYQANLLIEDSLIPAMVYHCKKSGKDTYWITMIEPN